MERDGVDELLAIALLKSQGFSPRHERCKGDHQVMRKMPGNLHLIFFCTFKLSFPY